MARRPLVPLARVIKENIRSPVDALVARDTACSASRRRLPCPRDVELRRPGVLPSAGLSVLCGSQRNNFKFHVNPGCRFCFCRGRSSQMNTSKGCCDVFKNKMDEIVTVDGPCPSAPGGGLEVGVCVCSNHRVGGPGEAEARRPSQARGQGWGAGRSWGASCTGFCSAWTASRRGETLAAWEGAGLARVAGTLPQERTVKQRLAGVRSPTGAPGGRQRGWGAVGCVGVQRALQGLGLPSSEMGQV